MIAAEERDDLTPRCPHCQHDVDRVFFRRLSGLLGRRYLYFCAACRAVIGVSHRKGFWMG
ncbi:MAG TPA: hypothetical protein VMV46_05335 [Thermoanaerobaculia bacterium]|nr:hypothetical protein [Thermoanaerobaculia bacterium]